MGELRESKKRETRQRISDVATALFFARGFEAVTVDEIAVEANVSKVTVFNYFARKEELFLDREDDLKLGFVREALTRRPKGRPLLEVLRGVVDTLREEKHPFVRFSSQTIGWWRVVAASPSLQARLRELWDEAIEGIASALAGTSPDSLARLVAGVIVLTFRTAHSEALRVCEHGGSAKRASALFNELLARGFEAASGMYPG